MARRWKKKECFKFATV